MQLRQPTDTPASRLTCLALMLLAASLGGCGGGSSDRSSGTDNLVGADAQSVVISGSVGDGPIVGATVTVKDSSGSILRTDISDVNANYRATIRAPGHAYPVTVEATGGTDIVTNSAPDFELLSASLHPSEKRANLNPYSTLIVMAARGMPGGLSAANVEQATQAVVKQLNFGLDLTHVPSPITTEVTAENIAIIVKSSEVMGEMIRRTRDALASRGTQVSGDDIMYALASDLTDGVLDGVGGTSADARIAALSHMTGAQVLIESMANDLRVNGASATIALDTAIRQSIPNTSNAQLTSSVRVTNEALTQARTSIAAAQAIAPSTALSTIETMLDNIQPDALAADVSTLMPGDTSRDLQDAIQTTALASTAQLDTVNSIVAAQYGNSGSDPTPPVNAAPTISGVPNTVAVEDTLYSFSPTAIDADGDSLSFTIANKPAWASFNAATGALVGMPGNAHVGTTRNISITVSDGSASATLGPFDLTVTNTNDAPTITGTPSTIVKAGSAYQFTPTAQDIDGDTLSFSVSNKPSWASFDPNTGRLSGTPSSADTGLTSGIVIRVTDGVATASLPAFDLSVTANTPANSAPTISGIPATSVAQNATYLFTPAAQDADGDSLVFSISNPPVWAQFDTSTGRLTGVPSNDHIGTTGNIVISVSDGNSTASLPAFSIAVSNVNDAPTITGAPATSVAEDSAYSFMPTARDIDGDTLTFSITNKPVWASFNAATGALTGTPGNNHVGTTGNIVISVSDGSAVVSLSPFAVTVTNVNDAPTISGSPATSVIAGASYSFIPSAQDVDGDTLTYSIVNKPSWAAFDPSTGALSGTPSTADVGTTSGILISVTDGTAVASLSAFGLSVVPDPVNGAPVVLYNFTEGTGTVVRDVSGVGTPLDLTIGSSSAVNWNSGGGLSLTASTLIASSGAATKLTSALKSSNGMTIEAWITPANVTQTGPARIVSLSQDSMMRNFTLGQTESSYDLRLRTTATDTNGRPSVTSAAGTATSSLTHIVYTRNASGTLKMYINGVEQISTTVGGDFSNWAETYRLALGNEMTGDRPWLGTFHRVAIYSRSFNATEVSQSYADGSPSEPPAGGANGVPVSGNDSATTDMNTPVTIAVLANDSGLTDAPITLSVMSNPSNGSVSVTSGNEIIYTPASNFTGSDSFVYRVSDGNGDMATGTVTVTVSCTSCPVVTNKNVTVSWDASTGDVLGYRIYFGPTEGTADTYASQSASTSVTYLSGDDLNMQVGDPICFRIKAYNSAGESDYSPAICGTI